MDLYAAALIRIHQALLDTKEGGATVTMEVNKNEELEHAPKAQAASTPRVM